MLSISHHRHRLYVRMLCILVGLFAMAFLDLGSWTKASVSAASLKKQRPSSSSTSNTVNTQAILTPTTPSPWSGELDLSVENDDEGMKGKCVAFRVKGHKDTLTFDQALDILRARSSTDKGFNTQAGLIFLDDPEGFISSGKTVNNTGIFHFYHFLEFILVAYHQLDQLMQALQNDNDGLPQRQTATSPTAISDTSRVQVPWIYVPLFHGQEEVCGVANGINCLIADILLRGKLNEDIPQVMPWYGMESNPPWLQAFHPAYHGQHEKRKWDEEAKPLFTNSTQQNFKHMQDTADIALILSLRRRDRCNYSGLNKGWNTYADNFPSQAWHDSLMAQLQPAPLRHSDDPLTTSSKPQKKLVVGYVDRQSTTRRMPQTEHDWLVQYLDSHPSIHFLHLQMQDYSAAEQLRVTSACDVLVGVHGNGLSHVLWMAPHRYVIELFWDDKPRQGGYALLAHTMKHKYLGLRDGQRIPVDNITQNFLPYDYGHDKHTEKERRLDGRLQIVSFLDQTIQELGITRMMKEKSEENGRKITAGMMAGKNVLRGSSKGNTPELDITRAEKDKHAMRRADKGGTHPRHCQGRAKHIHLAVGKDPAHAMTISFASKFSDPHFAQQAPIAGVHIGRQPHQLLDFVGEQEFPLHYNSTYPNQDGYYYSPYQHHITIDGLEPNTTYYYIPVVGNYQDVGNREAGLQKLVSKKVKDHPTQHIENYVVGRNNVLLSKKIQRQRKLAPPPYEGSDKSCAESHRVRSFTTAPESTSEAGPATFAIIGDLGQFEHSKETLVHMKEHKEGIDAVVLVGDIAYTSNDHRRWDTFFDFLDDYSIFDQVPLQIATGNHDIDNQENGTAIFQAYENRFRMPRVRPAQLGLYDRLPEKLDMHSPAYPLPYEWGNAYYSFNYGPAKHVILSAYSSMEPDSTQYDWLVGELESVDRDQTPWVLVSMHVPIYNTFAAHLHDLQIIAAREHLEPLFVKHHVNVVFSGHIHAYQRTDNVAFNKRHPRGPIHLTIGAGGRQCNASFKNKKPEDWLAKRDASYYGYGRFTISNRTHAEWSWIPLSPSEIHDYNVVKGEDEHLPRLEKDKVVVQNQFYLVEG